MNSYYVYILASGNNGTLYIGVTSDLIRRVQEHKQGQSFTKKYKVDRLVYFEDTNDISVATTREKQLKAWRQDWKIELIGSLNPEWRDLYEEIMQE
jgi:putative endonuclease